MIKEWPLLINSLADTGKRNCLVGDGYAYIDTGITWAGANYNVVADLELKYGTGTAFIWGTGVWNSNTLLLHNGLSYYNRNSNVAHIDLGADTWGKIHLGVGTYTLNDNSPVTFTTNNQAGSNNVNIKLFASPNTDYRTIVRMRYFKMTCNGTLRHDYVPFVRNGEAGFLDLVDNSFYGNARNTGSFTIETEEI